MFEMSPCKRSRKNHQSLRRYDSSITTSHDDGNINFHKHIGGYWPENEWTLLLERQTTFNVFDLQKVNVKNDGARHWLSMIKFAEGGSNPVAGPEILLTVLGIASVESTSLYYPAEDSIMD
jgi:hypothetical protein